MTDHTKKTTFAAFVNIDKSDKYWIEGHWEYSEDTPGLFRFNTKEEKQRVQEVAQSYLDNWGVKGLELVVFEVKSRHEVKLKKRSQEEKQAESDRILKEAADRRSVSEQSNDTTEAPVEIVKRRGRKPKTDATIPT